MKPRNVKYNKTFRNIDVYKKMETNSVDLDFGTYGLKSVAGGRISSKHIEGIKKILKKNIKRKGTLSVRIFPERGLSEKPVSVRMGKGKGNVAKWVNECRAGRMLFEIKGFRRARSKNILFGGLERMPIKSVIVGYKI
jgi:large subunit ribosomal protein L16